MTKDVIELAREAGFGMQMALLDDPFAQSHAQRLYQQLAKFAALVAARERERVAQEFDRRAVLSDGGPAVGWYEPNEPAEIVRALNTEGEGNDRP